MSDEMFIEHCSPTLAGLKTGNIFTCPFTSLDEVRQDIRRLNAMLRPKGLLVLPLRFMKGKVLIYLFRPAKLDEDLMDTEAARLLTEEGYGRIGRRTGELFHAFGCSVLAHSRHLKDDAPDYVEQVPREELLRRSDIVVLHCPLNDSTRGMIDAAALSQMKPTAFLINVARGPVVVEADLVRALEAGTIAGAGVDVFDVEPPLPPQTPLLRAPRTLLTPHVAFATAESMSLRAGIVFDNLRAWLDGAPQNVVL